MKVQLFHKKKKSAEDSKRLSFHSAATVQDQIHTNSLTMFVYLTKISKTK